MFKHECRAGKKICFYCKAGQKNYASVTPESYPPPRW